MLSGRSKIWVMDSTQSAVEFKANFGADLDVRVIPCVINSNQSFEKLSQLKKNQICIVNTIEPRKRTSLAIAGFKEAKNLGKISEDWKLFIFGNEGWQEKSLVESLRRNGFGQDVVFIEGASDFELEKIYAESRIVLSASAAEGFGLPPLEGMAHGCLPVVSDIPQHRETMGDLAFYFDGNDPSGIAAQLGQAINELKLNQDEIIKSTTKYVIDNFSALVIAKQWEVLLDSL
jgi:glycosyltransferase involved in cell wall biosynthesis